MKFIDDTKKKLEKYQNQHAYLAFPVAVIKRYGDDKTGKQAALITYYAFLSLFPLLLSFITILGIVIGNDPALQARISDQVFKYFPALGNDLKGNVQTIKASGFVLAIQLLVIIYGARGLAAMLQEAFNNVWHIEKAHRPGFIGDNLRSFAMMASVGLGVILGTVLSFTLGSILDFGVVGTLLLGMLNIAVSFGLLLVVFRLGTSNQISMKNLLLGAVVATVGLLTVQHFGTYIMNQQLPKLQGTYGSFALTLAILFWIYLQAQIIMYALTITAVRAQKDWPRKLF